MPSQGCNSLTLQNASCINEYKLKRENLLGNIHSVNNRVIFSHFLVNKGKYLDVTAFLRCPVEEGIPGHPGCPLPSAPSTASQVLALLVSCFSMRSFWCQLSADGVMPVQMGSAVPVTFPLLLGPSLASSFAQHLANENAVWATQCSSHPTGGERVTCTQIFVHAFTYGTSITAPSCESQHQSSSGPWLVPFLFRLCSNFDVLLGI